MAAAPHLLMLDALLGLVERELDLDTTRPVPDLRRLGEQVQRIVAVHVRLAAASRQAWAAAGEGILKSCLALILLRLRWLLDIQKAPAHGTSVRGRKSCTIMIIVVSCLWGRP